jgi:hypothetical protein
MNVYLYLFHDRIIHWMPQTMFSKPLLVSGLKWYAVNAAPPIPLDEMVMQENYSYNLQKGYFVLEKDWPLDWSDRSGLVAQLNILGSLSTLENIQKLKYTDNSIGRALSDILLIDEIRDYRQTGSIDNCTIMKSMLETTDADLMPEALVTKLWLQYESYRAVVAYLKRLEYRVRQMMAVGQLDQAGALINLEFEKIRM